MRTFLIPWIVAAGLLSGCTRSEPPPAPQPALARNVVVITIDTLRADHVGAYGYRAARTPTLDTLAHAGVRFDQAFATAPITLVSHASLMTGRYPPGHDARHNGLRMDLAVPTLAEALGHTGIATGGFIAAFPLDRRFGLIKGFHAYGDRMPRGPDGRLANERPGRMVVDEALAWYAQTQAGASFPVGPPVRTARAVRQPAGSGPGAPPARARTTTMSRRRIDRWADCSTASARSRATTLIVVAGDHGEAFGEHGEISHSLFTYDTTLRVPLIVAGAGLPHGTLVAKDPVSLVDVAPTVASRSPALGGVRCRRRAISRRRLQAEQPLRARALYAESFAPLLDFGWSPLRTLRERRLEVHRRADSRSSTTCATIPARRTTFVGGAAARRGTGAADRRDLATRRCTAQPAAAGSARRSRACRRSATRPAVAAAAAIRPDPKDRRELAARPRADHVRRAAGRGARARAARYPEARIRETRRRNVRLGYVLLDAGRCAEAVPHFTRRDRRASADRGRAPRARRLRDRREECSPRPSAR